MSDHTPGPKCECYYVGDMEAVIKCPLRASAPTLLKERDELKAQRDELLATTKDLMELLLGRMKVGDSRGQLFNRAEAAIRRPESAAR
jgi:hypothetical protein